MVLFLWVGFLVAHPIAFVTAADLPKTFFINPPAAGSEGFYVEDDVYQIGVETALKWETNMTEYSVYLWGQYADLNNAYGDSTPIYTKSSDDQEEGGFEWNVTTGIFSLENDTNIYFLSLGPDDSIDNSATSHYFNVTSALVNTGTSITSSAATASSTESTKPTTKTTTTPIVSTGTSTSISSLITTSTFETPTSTSTSAPSKSSSSLGIGLGLGLGIPFILLLASFFGLKLYQYRRQNSSIWPASIRDQTPKLGIQQGKYSGVPQDINHGTGNRISSYKSELPTSYNLSELPSGHEPVELAVD